MALHRAITTRDMKGLATALDALGVLARSPQGGALSGSLSLPQVKRVLRVDCIGKAAIYDPTQGTLNLRHPLVSWEVDFDTRWASKVASQVRDYLKPAGKAQAAKMRAAGAPARPPAALTEAPPSRKLQVALRILEWCAQGLCQAAIKKEMQCAATTVRRVIEGRQLRGKGPSRISDPYMPELDGQRRELLQRRNPDADDQMVAALRARLGQIAPTASPLGASPAAARAKSETLKLKHVKRILAQWVAGACISAIARDPALPISRGDTTRVRRIIVGGFYTHDARVPLYRVIEGAVIDPLRVDALRMRATRQVPSDNSERALRERLAEGW